MEILSCENVAFKYNESTDYAISDCTFSVKKGEKIMLCGASGSGKSTLLRLLKRELSPRGELSGNITLMGKDRSELSDRESAEKIGFVMQSPDSQTVCDKVSAELAFGLESFGVKSGEIQSRVGEMAAFFGIEPLYDRDISTLSGGQKQLVALCSVMATDPDILLLDEPTAQLDPVAARELLGILDCLNKEMGVTIIIAEHDPEELFDSCDKILYLAKGKTEFFGTPALTAKYFVENALEGFLPETAKAFARLCDDLPLNVRQGRAKLEKLGVTDIPKQAVTDTERAEPYALQCKNLWQRYEKNSPDILKGCDLGIRKGECYGLLGSNGGGKSTLLRVICGLCKPYMGTVSLFGKKQKAYKNGSLFREMLAFLPQEPVTMFVKESVREDLLQSGDKVTVENVSQRMGIEHLLDRHPWDLSGGEIQKCAFAKILLADPKIIVLDECTKGMDSFAKKALGDILLDLKDEGRTILLVTHDLEFAAQYCDRCGLLFDGKIVAEDNAVEFFSHNRFYTTAAAKLTRGFFSGAVTSTAVRERLAMVKRGQNEQ
ncbi:ABC transporter ATP-binding protein [Ruminococcus bicirculans (ex Wegman et al. 2014)]|jgi:energy-coupling factor transporter ATP-binding protein EcfA2|uniref:ABC transporter ATP-binding protein n=1 Tax=Ruminococcus TaxID=1263 RepID=UPI00266C1F15|nr:ABC transporter ATP-binding protein [uncultured Ruminococcus sp.]